MYDASAGVYPGSSSMGGSRAQWVQGVLDRGGDLGGVLGGVLGGGFVVLGDCVGVLCTVYCTVYCTVCRCLRKAGGGWWLVAGGGGGGVDGLGSVQVVECGEVRRVGGR